MAGCTGVALSGGYTYTTVHFTHHRHYCHCLPCVTLGSQLYCCGTVRGAHIYNNVISHTTDTAVTVRPCDIRKPAVLLWHCQGGTHIQQCHFTHYRHCCHCPPCVTLGSQLYCWCSTLSQIQSMKGHVMPWSPMCKPCALDIHYRKSVC